MMKKKEWTVRNTSDDTQSEESGTRSVGGRNGGAIGKERKDEGVKAKEEGQQRKGAKEEGQQLTAGIC